ncbi:MAG: hypothetical protein IKS51_07445 [Erysipelotrichaceae bacterium]|nr:hypothetical protein [Erysipelotrichaceae bacterium]
MKDDEIAVSFSKSFIRDRLTLPSTEGGSYDLFIIEMPDEEGDERKIKRTFTVPESRLKTDKKYEYIRYTYLKKDRLYRVMRALYDENARSTRVEETFEMTGQEIHDVFNRYRNRKRQEFERKFESQETKEGK